MTEQENGSRASEPKSRHAWRVFRETQQKSNGSAMTSCDDVGQGLACILDVKRRRNRKKFVSTRNQAAVLTF